MRHQHSACPSPRKIGNFVLLGLAAGLLGGCETNGGPSNPLSELVAYSSGAQANAQANAQASAPARQEVRQPEKPRTRAQAAMDCWSMVEKTRAASSIEARADFVHDCIDKKLKSSDGGPGTKPDARENATAPKPRQRAEAKPAS